MHLLLVFLFSSSLLASTDLAYSTKWLKLLHYKKNLLWGYTAQADTKSFYLHPKGKHDPKLELEASIKDFAKTTAPGDGDGACRFPARFKWLNQELGHPWKVDFSGCKRYLEFLSKVAARRATMMFSSYYLSNPNSAFGHTFFRLSRFEDKKETEMLDYGISYAAETEGADPFSYPIKGLFGGFTGRFSVIPFYYKVREYSDGEFRDLWSFELKLTPLQVLEMVDHIWEMGNTEFDYYFFQENCAYHLLSILEVVLPEKDLTDNYHWFAIPADTIRLLKTEGLIDEGKRRESVYSRLLRLSRGFTHEELKTAGQIVEHPEEVNSYVDKLDHKQAARILDVSIEAFDYANAEKILVDEPISKAKKAHILKARAFNPIVTDTGVGTSELFDSPAESHPPTRWTLGNGYDHAHGNFQRFEARAAFHDFLDPRRGSLKESQLEMFRASFSNREKEHTSYRPRFEDLTIFSIKNFPTQSFWSSPVSWELELAGRQINRRQCFDCPGAVFFGSYGNTLQRLNGRFLASILMNGEANAQTQFELGYRIGFGPKLVSRFIFNEKLMLGLNVLYHLNTYRPNELGADQELAGNLELRWHMKKNFSLFIQTYGVERKDYWDRGGQLGFQIFH